MVQCYFTAQAERNAERRKQVSLEKNINKYIYINFSSSARPKYIQSPH